MPNLDSWINQNEEHTTTKTIKYRILDRVLKNVIVRRIFTIHQLGIS